MELDDYQKAVVAHQEGRAIVAAVAGSGKTTAVVHRIARMINDGVKPERLLGLTFSKDAADQLTARVAALLPKGKRAPRLGTFHSLGLEILRASGYAGWEVHDGKYTVMVKKAVTAVGKQQRWDYGDAKKALKFIHAVKAAAWYPDDRLEEIVTWAENHWRNEGKPAALKPSFIVEVYVQAELARNEAKVLTFDDMIALPASYFETDEAFRASWASRWDFLIQDEAQDQNRAQAVMAEGLTREHGNYMAVGDPSQTIYSFRGADARRLMRMHADGAALYTLPLNYRSTPQIVEVANRQLAKVETRLVEAMTAARGGAASGVAYVHSPTAFEEAQRVANDVLLALHTYRSEEIAVLVRMVRQASYFEAVFSRLGIPYVLGMESGFWSAKLPGAVVAYLRVAAGTYTADDLVTTLQRPTRYITNHLAGALARATSRPEYDCDSWGDFVELALSRFTMQAYLWDRLRQWARTLDTLAERIQSEQPTMACIGRLFVDTGLVSWAEQEEGEGDAGEDTTDETRKTILEHAGRHPTVPDFLRYVRTMERNTGKRAGLPGHSLITTMHRAKGREWPLVFVTGFNAGVLPHAKGDPQEEARIAYVALTRAQDELVVTSSKEASPWVADLFAQANQGTPRLCPGCREVDGEHDFGPTCTLRDEADAEDPTDGGEIEDARALPPPGVDSADDDGEFGDTARIAGVDLSE